MSSPISYPPSVYIKNIDWINARSPSQSNWVYDGPHVSSDAYSSTTPLDYDDDSVEFVTVIPAPAPIVTPPTTDTESISSMAYNELRYLKYEYLDCVYRERDYAETMFCWNNYNKAIDAYPNSIDYKKRAFSRYHGRRPFIVLPFGGVKKPSWFPVKEPRFTAPFKQPRVTVSKVCRSNRIRRAPVKLNL